MGVRGDTLLRADSEGRLLAHVRELGAVYWGGGHPHPDGKEPAWYAWVELPDDDNDDRQTRGARNAEPRQMELEI